MVGVDEGGEGEEGMVRDGRGGKRWEHGVALL